MHKDFAGPRVSTSPSMLEAKGGTAECTLNPLILFRAEADRGYVPLNFLQFPSFTCQPAGNRTQSESIQDSRATGTLQAVIPRH